MPQKADIQFTLPSMKISSFRSSHYLRRKHHHIISPFASVQFSNHNSVLQFIDSVKTPFTQLVDFVKTPFTQFVNSLQPSSNIFNSTKNHSKRNPFHLKSLLLSSASLALTGPDEGSLMTPPKIGSQSASQNDEERVLISEVFVRNKDGEELERKDLENEAMTALKTCRPNSALTIHEVQEDVHRIIGSGYFSSCMPVAVDTRDGIRLVFQVWWLHNYIFVYDLAVQYYVIWLNVWSRHISWDGLSIVLF